MPQDILSFNDGYDSPFAPPKSTEIEWLQAWISIPKFSHSYPFTQRFMMCELPPCGIPGAIRRKEERSKATPPFDASTLLSIDPELCRRVGFAQGHESFDLAQEREPVERLVEWHMMP
jgi:hypothetical protein